jgi:hypothetical protein
MVTRFSSGRSVVFRVKNGQREGEEVPDKEELDFCEGRARNKFVLRWKEMQKWRRRYDNGEHRYPARFVLGLPYTPYVSTQWPRIPEKVCIGVDDADDMGERNVFACGCWPGRLDGLRVVRSRGESNRKAANNLAECLGNRVRRLLLICGLLASKAPGSCLFCNSDGMTIEGDRCVIYRSPSGGVDSEPIGSSTLSNSITWSGYEHVVNGWVSETVGMVKCLRAKECRSRKRSQLSNIND